MLRADYLSASRQDSAEDVHHVDNGRDQAVRGHRIRTQKPAYEDAVDDDSDHRRNDGEDDARDRSFKEFMNQIWLLTRRHDAGRSTLSAWR